MIMPLLITMIMPLLITMIMVVAVVARNQLDGPRDINDASGAGLSRLIECGHEPGNEENQIGSLNVSHLPWPQLKVVGVTPRWGEVRDDNLITAHPLREEGKGVEAGRHRQRLGWRWRHRGRRRGLRHRRGGGRGDAIGPTACGEDDTDDQGGERNARPACRHRTGTGTTTPHGNDLIPSVCESLGHDLSLLRYANLRGRADHSGMRNPPPVTGRIMLMMTIPISLPVGGVPSR